MKLKVLNFEVSWTKVLDNNIHYQVSRQSFMKIKHVLTLKAFEAPHNIFHPFPALFSSTSLNNKPQPPTNSAPNELTIVFQRFINFTSQSVSAPVEKVSLDERSFNAN